jgi:hypothetical protein
VCAAQVEKAKTRDPMKKREAEEDKEDRKLQIESDERVEKAGHGPLGPERTVTRTAGDSEKKIGR